MKARKNQNLKQVSWSKCNECGGYLGPHDEVCNWCDDEKPHSWAIESAPLTLRSAGLQ